MMPRSLALLVALAPLLIVPAAAAAGLWGLEPSAQAPAVPPTNLGKTLARDWDEPNVLPLTGFPATAPESSAGADYQIKFTCPPQTESAYSAAGCPQYVPDVEDIMGQPVLLVDPKDFNLVSFHALHGGHGLHDGVPGGVLGSAPSSRSRDDVVHQTHTAFWSTDFTAQWHDNPNHAPAAIREKGDAGTFAEDNGATLDAQGRVSIGVVYAYHEQEAQPWNYKIAFWKSDRINRPISYDNNLAFVPQQDTTDKMESLHMTYVQATNKVVALWRQAPITPPALANPLERNLKSWISVAWTPAGTGADWHLMDRGQVIGPCTRTTNPLVLGDKIYVGCFADDGYGYGHGAQVGYLQLHTVSTQDWTTSYVAQVPILRGDAVLADRRDGKMVIASAGVEGHKAFVDISYGERGTNWSSPENFGPKLTMAGDRTTLLEARVTALAYIKESGNLHLFYLERFQKDPLDAEHAADPEFHKRFSAIRAYGGYQDDGNITYASALARARADYPNYLVGFDEGVFGDLHDSILVWTDPKSGVEREFVAYGDYGYTRFAEVTEENFVPACCPVPPAVPPIPAGAPATNPAVVGALAGALATAMVATMLLHRRKRQVEAPSL